MHKNNNKNDQNPSTEAAKTTEVCTLTGCIDDEDQNRLKCRNCQRMVHYECTQLPLYQLQIFVNTYNNQYVCHNCVRITRSLKSKIGENTYHMMQKEIAKKDDVIMKLKNESDKNREIIKIDIDNILTKKITDLETKTRKIIKEEIEHTKNFISSSKTYAEITKTHKENLKSAVKEQKEEDRKEERDIESRKRNIIIHGIMESTTDTKEKEQQSDKLEIEELLNDIDIRDIKPVHHRIGVRHQDQFRYRPIKVTLQNVNEKERIMSNLYKLKKFGNRGISITEDFTITERKKIKEKCEEAKKKNSECDGEFVWRVRGSPRTFLRLIKTPKNSIDFNKFLLSLTNTSSYSSIDGELPQKD